MGFWVFGKKVLLPIGQARIDYNSKRVYAKLAKNQVESLPEFNWFGYGCRDRGPDDRDGC